MARKSAYFGVLLSLAMICGYVEMLIPFDFGIPGIKLGLANIVALWLLYKNGFVQAMAVNVGRILLVGILFGNVMSIFYSLTGGILAVTAMFFIRKFKCFSIVGVSIAGAFFHNVGQLIAASLVIGTRAVIYYLPFLSISAVATGLLIGLLGAYLVRRVKYTT